MKYISVYGYVLYIRNYRLYNCYCFYSLFIKVQLFFWVVNLNWIWRLSNMAFERGVVLEDWRFAVFIPLYKGKEREKERLKN